MASRGRLVVAVIAAAALAAGTALIIRSRARPESARVVVVGLDGADWQLLDRYRAAGAMPELDRLVREGRSGVLEGDVVERVVDDVLAQPLLVAALQVDDGRQPVEVGPGWVELEALELIGIDLERQVLDLVVAGHGGGHYRPVDAGSSGRAAAQWR